MSSARDWQRVLDSVRDAEDRRVVQRRLWRWLWWFRLRTVLRIGAVTLLLTVPALVLVLAVSWTLQR